MTNVKNILKLVLTFFIYGLSFSPQILMAQEKVQDIDIIVQDSAMLKATYYSPGKPGPGVLLLHQCNMDRKSWKKLALNLAQNGIHVLTFDYRGYGESSPKIESSNLSADIDSAFAFLISQSGVNIHQLAVGGASCGVNNAIMTAKRITRFKALLLFSGPTTAAGLSFLRDHPELAIFGAASSEEEFAVRSIKEMVQTSKNSLSTMIELNNAGHGAPMFDTDSNLLPMVLEWMKKVMK